MNLFEQLRVFYKLKEVKRGGKVGTRSESTAEHVFSAMMLAEFYMKKTRPKLDEKKVLKLLLYHDLAEIYTGDLKMWEGKAKEVKNDLEKKAMKKLSGALPKELAVECIAYVYEYQNATTRESKFAHAIDNFDAILHNMKSPQLYKKYKITEALLRRVKGKFYEPFPLLNKDLTKALNEMKKNKVIE